MKAAAVYEAVPGPRPDPAPGREARPSLRTRLRAYQATRAPARALAPVDRAVQVPAVARTEPYERSGAFLWAELRGRGRGAPAADPAVVADGSPHLDAVVDAQLRLPGIQLTRSRDLPHAQQQLWAVSSAVFGEGNALGVRWGQAPLLALERGQADRVCGALTALAEAHAARAPEAAHTARKAAAYPPSWPAATRWGAAWRRAPASASAPTA